MNSKRFRLVLIGLLLLSVVIFFVTCTFGLNLLRKKSDEMVNLKLKNQTADAQLANLVASKKEVEKYSYFKGVAATVIPNDKNQAQAVLDIFQIAQESNIEILSIKFPNSTLGQKVTPTTTPAPASSGTDATTPSSTAPKKVISQALPVPGVPGLYSLQLSITPQDRPENPAHIITYPKMIDFLRRIENNRRTAQITGINIQPSAQGSNGGLTFELTLNIFIKP